MVDSFVIFSEPALTNWLSLLRLAVENREGSLSDVAVISRAPFKAPDWCKVRSYEKSA